MTPVSRARCEIVDAGVYENYLEKAASLAKPAALSNGGNRQRKAKAQPKASEAMQMNLPGFQ